MKTMPITFMALTASVMVIHAETSPFRLPELAPSVAETTVDVPPDFWRTSPDLEMTLSFFEENQAKLSDYSRVAWLKRTAESFLGQGPHPAFWRAGVPEKIIDLALAAARGAENSDTVVLRSMRVKLALGSDPFRGAREAIETYAVLKAIDPARAVLLCEDPKNSERERVAFVKALNADLWRHEAGVFLESTIAGMPRASETEDANGFYPSVERWLDEHEGQRPAGFQEGQESPHPLVVRPDNPAVCETLQDLHLQNVEGFVGASGFGMVRQMRRDQRQIYRDEYGDYWRVTRSQLVSVYEHDTPVAYDINPLSIAQMMAPYPPAEVQASERSMDKRPRFPENASDVPTRALTTFESTALKKALVSREPVIAQKGRRIDMVAPILAQASCLRCHDAEEREPLGAFTYVIEPNPATAEFFEKRAQRLERHRKQKASQ